MRYHKRKKPMSEINVVPYIDVMLVLLVIFMITTPLLTQGVKIDLPKANAKSIAVDAELPLIVSVDAEGRYYLNVYHEPNTPLDPEVLATRIAAEVHLAEQRGRPRDVLINGDQGAVYGQVVQAMVLLQYAGVNNVGLMTEATEQTRALLRVPDESK